jgi:hypothetical protein
LITTRRHDVARTLRAQTVDVNEMTTAEAADVLVNWLDEPPADRTPLVEFAQYLGEWPLLLGLAAAQLRETIQADHKPLAEAIAGLRQRLERKGFTYFDRAKEGERNRAVSLSLEVSLEHLAAWRARYLELVVFPEDTDLPLAVLARLWHQTAGLDNIDSEDAWQAMRRLSLFTRYDPTQHTVRLHDVVRRYLVEQQGDQLPTLHQQLLAAYRATQTGDGWATAPDDGYLYDHLTYHLDGSVPPTQEASELKALFASPAWLHARVVQAGYTYDGYIGDLMTAWQRAQTHARQQIATGQPLTTLADCVRYALLRTSLNSLSSNYVPALVTQGVKIGLWTAHRALSTAAKIPESQARYTLVMALLPFEMLTPTERQEGHGVALEAALKIGNEGARARALTGLAAHLSQSLLSQALDAALKIGDEGARASALTGLAAHLSGEAQERTLSQALEAALKIRYEESRARALTGLAAHLSEPLLSQALDAALKIEYEGARASALTGLAPHLSQPLLAQVITAELLALQGSKREVVLRLLASTPLFNPTRLGLPSESVAEISRHIVEICTEWQWA